MCWINPKLNSTLNKHTLHATFLENEPNVYGAGKLSFDFSDAKEEKVIYK